MTGEAGERVHEMTTTREGEREAGGGIDGWIEKRAGAPEETHTISRHITSHRDSRDERRAAEREREELQLLLVFHPEIISI